MIEIPIKPMSLGRAWSQTKTGRRFLVPEAKKYKEMIAYYCKEYAFFDGYAGAMACRLEFHGPWLTKEHRLSKTAGDIDNFSKLLIDSLCEAYNFDDSQIVEMHLKKIIADDWKIRIELKAISLEKYLFPIPD